MAPPSMDHRLIACVIGCATTASEFCEVSDRRASAAMTNWRRGIRVGQRELGAALNAFVTCSAAPPTSSTAVDLEKGREPAHRGEVAEPTEDEGGVEACPQLISHPVQGILLVFVVR